jgi:hypothetical protein
MNEGVRLETLCSRDGKKAAREWAQMTAAVYRLNISNRNNFASQLEWRPLFERSILQLKIFAETGVISMPTIENHGKAL